MKILWSKLSLGQLYTDDADTDNANDNTHARQSMIAQAHYQMSQKNFTET